MFCFGVIKDFVHTVCKENRNNKLQMFFLFLDTVYSSRETSKICDKFTGKFIYNQILIVCMSEL